MTDTIKMRTMETAYQAIKEMDPDTAITRWAIRQAVSGGYIPSRRVGNKYLFNLDTLLDYFNVKAS
ncbi:MAG: DNA-binding protein [Firmicutes bacterium]|nr:DNA-binding protein [Bacillota bacterium]MBR0455712.1 DNA-binding protein [Bacillota bacterium]